MPTDSKLNVLFDQQNKMLAGMEDLQKADRAQDIHCGERWHSCDDRFKKMEKFVYWITGGLSGIAFVASVVSLVLHVIY